MTLNELIRERKKALRELKRSLKTVDTTLEKQERKINQQLSRRIKVPEIEDLETIILMTKELDNALVIHMRQLDATQKIYSTV
jgi:Sec-independent protein translocase protein TatA